MRKFVLLILLIIGAVAVFPTLAQEANNPADNWCFDGGPLEGKCGMGDTDESNWMWLYGYYGAQIAKGTFTVNDIPEEYRIGLQDSGRSSSTSSVIRDGDGNIISTGNSPNFVGNIIGCRYDKNTIISVGWIGLDVPGDRIEVSTDEGSASANTFLPVSNFGLELKFGGQTKSISEGGNMSIFYEGILLGTSELNGINKCTNNTPD